MYTTTRLRKSPPILHDRYPAANPLRPSIEAKQMPVVPPEYRALHTYVKSQTVSPNTSTSFELFAFLDEKTKSNLRSLTYNQRVQTYKNLMDLIGEWWKYDVRIIHWEIHDGTKYTIEGGPIVILKGEEVPFSQIAKETLSGLIQKLMNRAKGS